MIVKKTTVKEIHPLPTYFVHLHLYVTLNSSCFLCIFFPKCMSVVLLNFPVMSSQFPLNLFSCISLIFMAVKVSKSCLLCKFNNLTDNAVNLRDSVILAIIITFCKFLFKYVFIDSNLSVKKIEKFVYSQQEQTLSINNSFECSPVSEDSAVFSFSSTRLKMEDKKSGEIILELDFKNKSDTKKF